MKGIQFLIDEQGNKTAVVIDLKKNAELWEDIYDQSLDHGRANEPREPIAAVKTRLQRAKRRSNG